MHNLILLLNLIRAFPLKLYSNNFLTKTRKYLFYYMLLFFGTCLFSIYIYVRFLRTRLPRDIPFELTFYSFIILLSICLMYLYSIKRLLKKNVSHQVAHIIFIRFQKPLKYVVNSLMILDNVIKQNIVPSLYKKFITNVIPKIIDFGHMEYVLLYYGFVLIPGYILLGILMVDVFWLHHIKTFYYFIFLGIVPLLYMYYNYSLHIIKEEYLIYLESYYASVLIEDSNSIDIPYYDRNPKAIYHKKEVSLREYFDIQLQQLNIEWPEYDEDDPTTREIIYTGFVYCKDEIYVQYEIVRNKTVKESTYEELQVLKKLFKEIEPKLLGLMQYIHSNKDVSNLYYIKHFKIILYTLYFITWTYILLQSISMNNVLDILNVLKMSTFYIEEPFSQTYL